MTRLGLIKRFRLVSSPLGGGFPASSPILDRFAAAPRQLLASDSSKHIAAFCQYLDSNTIARCTSPVELVLATRDMAASQQSPVLAYPPRCVRYKEASPYRHYLVSALRWLPWLTLMLVFHIRVGQIGGFMMSVPPHQLWTDVSPDISSIDGSVGPPHSRYPPPFQ
ncbi:hypothetical protein J6590_007071 [Homalodisca vitripennis]|nr:hypothetical protein J6590_007071 [Homalodisca vitripennis]